MTHLSDAVVAHLTAELMLPELPPRYLPQEVIGRGGMGVVWRCRDTLLERDVAVKLLVEHLSGAAWAARLAREARILAQLEHPGIVAVHDAGMLSDGRAWYAMRLVVGEPLDRARGQLGTLGDVVRVMIRLADTIAFAHANGVIHRDLTPRNVMLGPFGEVLVLDWGVARLVADGGSQDGAIVGTPGYHAPEQAAGQDGDARSDVYGLGAILRDLLRSLSVAPPKPLAAIRDRAMAPRAEHRFATVVEFRADLARFQDGAPVHAYLEPLGERVLRLATQYRTPLLLVTAYLVMRLVVLWWRGI
ncbi:MAG: serine/threonine protein kinase [Gemmatimonadetes bacterium]|nr:serine/threonine protein kinase [Gemmatimonadota bacterium]